MSSFACNSFILVIDLYICDVKAPGLVGICFHLLLCITDLLNQSTHTHFKKRLIKQSEVHSYTQRATEHADPKGHQQHIGFCSVELFVKFV